MSHLTAVETMAPTQKGKMRDLPEIEQTMRVSAIFDAFLYPNRSLPNSGFIVLMSIVIGVNLCLGVAFTLVGAWPILIFGGLDILLVWFAFKTSYRQGRLHERVRISSDEMQISRVLPSGHEMRWSLHPYWTDIEIDETVCHESQVRVRSKGKVLILGAFLSPQERDGFGKKLRDAVFEARRS